MTTIGAPVRGLLAAAAPGYAEHLRLLGPLPPLTGEQAIALVQASGLTGRGGAGFPTSRKLAAVAAGRTAVVVANGAEGEPASSKDRVLLTTAPHLVLDGLAVAVLATGATNAYLYAPADLLDGLVPALRERRDPVPVQPVRAPGTFVAGQETAVVAAVDGRPALPRTAPPAVFDRGVRGGPPWCRTWRRWPTSASSPGTDRPGSARSAPTPNPAAGCRPCPVR